MAISISRLVAETNGRYVEVAGAPRNQCVDLVNYWLRMIGKPIITGRNAIDFDKAPGYIYRVNTREFVPQEGDIAIFNIGTYGDVAVVAPGTNVRDMVVYGQNFPIGAPCRTRTHRMYGGVKGFLLLSSSRKSVGEIAQEVIGGKWGVGSERKHRLTQAGYDYAAVQAEVNRKLR